MDTENLVVLRDAPNMAEQKVETNRLSHSGGGQGRDFGRDSPAIRSHLMKMSHFTPKSKQRKLYFAYVSFFIFMTIKLHFHNAIYVFAPEQLHFF